MVGSVVTVLLYIHCIVCISIARGRWIQRECQHQQWCPAETYDPKVHAEIWHNDNPFVLENYRKTLKKCRGCNSAFVGPKSDDHKFVISHEELRAYWTRHGQKVSPEKAFYHCSASCLCPRHTYFDPNKVLASPEVARKLTAEDVKYIRQYSINLSFLRI